MHFFIFLFAAIVFACAHIFSDKSKEAKTTKRMIEIFLLYLLVFLVGLGGIMGFMGHAFVPDKIADYIGWTRGSHFQFEVAVTNLSYGILGLLCIWFRGNFWLATILGVSVFYFGATYGHIIDMIQRRNFAPGNAGMVLYIDIIEPLVLIALFIYYKILEKKSAGNS